MLDLVPGEPPAVRLMDTVHADRAGVRDSLTTVAELRRFLAGLPGGAPGQLTGADLAQARALRDALRRLAADVTGDDRPRARAEAELAQREAVAVVNAAVAGAPPPVLQRADGRWRFGTTGPRSVPAVLAELAAEGAQLVADPAAPLRACRAPGCVLYFVADHPRREWCGVSCGNRVRAARHYARTRGRSSSAAR